MVKNISQPDQIVGGIKQARLNELITGVAKRDKAVAKALEIAGYPPERLRPHGFSTLLRVIASQQLSVKAAATIAGRVEALMDMDATPEKLLALSDEALRGAGLSRPKVTYVRSLAGHVADGSLDIAGLMGMDSEAVVKQITAVKGLGRWSAEMYMISSLGHEDVWPIDDLGVQEGIARILGLEARPNPKELQSLGDQWRPARSAMAIFAWHYYAKVPI